MTALGPARLSYALLLIPGSITEFEAYYRELNASAGEEKIKQGIEELQKFQGASSAARV